MTPTRDLLLLVSGPPHAGSLTTTVLRLTDAALALGARVEVWACGSFTLLTQRALGETKPRNLHELDARYPSTGRVVRDLLVQHDGRLIWRACRFCSEDRGAVAHLPEVRSVSPLAIFHHIAAAGTTVYIGGWGA